jgi:2-polyprenyl-3-methyl-5-hydroxy-6-metoxy-1,4-benzoquinol methylase
MTNSDKAKQFWQDLWKDDTTPWELSGPHSLLESLTHRAAGKSLPPGAKIFVPGCGRAHDAAWLARQGYQVTATDYVPEAIEEAKKLYGEVPGLSFEVADVFVVKADEKSKYDAVYDRAMICALNPSKRGAYLQACQDRLKNSGIFMGILFSELKEVEEGPPFVLNLMEFNQLARPLFKIQWSEEKRSPQTISFLDSELLVVAEKTNRID